MARFPRPDQARIVVALKRLAEDLGPTGYEPVRGAPRGTYRVRVGDDRLIYTVLDEDQVIVVARITRRSESTYRGLE
ncbi:MAG: type II toxin-antitoxin system RelE/ParE family toxin [Anaerolineae bacterium]|jgi:mRNA-degrading endonuclease RelE of RelBE toxin-antitoxin system